MFFVVKSKPPTCCFPTAKTPVASPAITLDDPGNLSVVLTAGLIDSVLDTDESATFQIIGTKTDTGGAIQITSVIDNLVIVGTVVPESARWLSWLPASRSRHNLADPFDRARATYEHWRSSSGR